MIVLLQPPEKRTAGSNAEFQVEDLFFVELVFFRHRIIQLIPLGIIPLPGIEVID